MDTVKAICIPLALVLIIGCGKSVEDKLAIDRLKRGIEFEQGLIERRTIEIEGLEAKIGPGKVLTQEEWTVIEDEEEQRRQMDRSVNAQVRDKFREEIARSKEEIARDTKLLKEVD